MARIILPDYLRHVVQHGHNRQVVFAGKADFCSYPDDVRELKTIYRIQVYAYCLMTNHLPLLLVCGEAKMGLGQMMKALVACATRYRNKLLVE